MSSHPIARMYAPGELSQSELSKLKQSNSNLKIHDLVEESQLHDLIKIRSTNNSEQIQRELELKYQDQFNSGVWVLRTDISELNRIVEEDDYLELITNRNHNLLTKDEQKKLYTATICIAGLSVGSAIAKSLCRSGIGNVFKLADFDTIDSTNLNRLDVPYSMIGASKATALAGQISGINPFVSVELFEDGLKEQNIESFMTADGGPTVVIDEIDDFGIKFKIRQEARKHKLPVLMMTSIGDNLLVDIERHDLEKTEYFNGVFSGKTDAEIKDFIASSSSNQLAVLLVDEKHVPKRASESLREIGKTLVGRPQLYSTILINAGIGSFLVKHLILGNLPTGRHFINLNSMFRLSEEFNEQQT